MLLDYLAIFFMLFCRQILVIKLLLNMFAQRWRLSHNLVITFFICLIALETFAMSLDSLHSFIPALYITALIQTLCLLLMVKIPVRFLCLYVLFMFHIGMLGHTLAFTLARLCFSPQYFYVASSIISSVYFIVLYYPIMHAWEKNAGLILNTKATTIVDITNLMMLLNIIGLIFTRDFSKDFSLQLLSARFFNVVPSILFIAIVIYLLNEIEVNTTINEKVHAWEQLHYAEKQYYTSVIDTWQKGRKQRHDARHKALLLLNYLHNKRYELVQQEIESAVAKINNYPQMTLCNNEIIDGIVGFWNMQAREQNINFAAKITIDKIMISDLDLAVLLGNTLENACQAAAKAEPDKFIELKIVTKNDTLLIVVRNRFNGQVVNKDGVYYSAKRDFAEPGIGLQSIGEIVKKLDGYMSVVTDNQVFTVFMAVSNKRTVSKDTEQAGDKNECSNL